MYFLSFVSKIENERQAFVLRQHNGMKSALINFAATTVAAYQLRYAAGEMEIGAFFFTRICIQQTGFSFRLK